MKHLLFGVGLFVLVSCEYGDVKTILYSPLTIYVTAPTNNEKYYFFTNQDTAFLVTMRLGISDLELIYDHSDEHFKTDSSYSFRQDTLLRGPFRPRTLMAVEQFTRPDLVTVNAPKALYSGIRFRLTPISKIVSDDSTRLASYSAIGNFNHKTFIFWNDSTVRISLSFENGSIKLDRPNGFVIKINSSKVFDPEFGGLNLELAKDGNNDGVIQIDPLNTDGNATVARSLFSLIVNNSSCESLE